VAQRRFVPYRKFAAGPGWLAVGPRIDHIGGETYSHIGLDGRAAACLADETFICGWLRECERGRLGIVLEAGTKADVADAYQQIEIWAEEHAHAVYRKWSPPRHWLPGR